MASRKDFEKLAEEAMNKASQALELSVDERLKFISTVDEYFRISKGMPEAENDAFYQMLKKKVNEF